MYGYDYDYTLASYKKGVEYLIHDIAKQHLVKSVVLSGVRHENKEEYFSLGDMDIQKVLPSWFTTHTFQLEVRLNLCVGTMQKNIYISYKFTLSKLSEKYQMVLKKDTLLSKYYGLKR